MAALPACALWECGPTHESMGARHSCRRAVSGGGWLAQPTAAACGWYLVLVRDLQLLTSALCVLWWLPTCCCCGQAGQVLQLGVDAVTPCHRAVQPQVSVPEPPVPLPLGAEQQLAHLPTLRLPLFASKASCD